MALAPAQVGLFTVSARPLAWPLFFHATLAGLAATGLSAFTVYMCSATMVATDVSALVTVAEVDPTNMPGVYSANITNIAGASWPSGAACLYITEAGMDDLAVIFTILPLNSILAA